jgi:hypothetical protein
MSHAAKPLDATELRQQYDAGLSTREIARAHKVSDRRVRSVLGIPYEMPQDSPRFTVELKIDYTEAQLDQAMAEFSPDEKAQAVGHIMFRRAGGL